MCRSFGGLVPPCSKRQTSGRPTYEVVPRGLKEVPRASQEGVGRTGPEEEKGPLSSDVSVTVECTTPSLTGEKMGSLYSREQTIDY